MKVSFHEVGPLFEQLLAGSVSREFASSWARRVRQAEDAGTLVYEPAGLEHRLWEAIQFLEGVDLRDSPDSYLHVTADMLAARSKLDLTVNREWTELKSVDQPDGQNAV